jgi:hypothetical protein
VFDLLVEECGAREFHRADFIHALTSTDSAEYRFGGSLGFGGKHYNEYQRLRVACYSDETTTGRGDAIRRVNGRLQALCDALFDPHRRQHCPHCEGAWTGPLGDKCPRCFEPVDESFLTVEV